MLTHIITLITQIQCQQTQEGAVMMVLCNGKASQHTDEHMWHNMPLPVVHLTANFSEESYLFTLYQVVGILCMRVCGHQIPALSMQPPKRTTAGPAPRQGLTYRCSATAITVKPRQAFRGSLIT